MNLKPILEARSTLLDETSLLAGINAFTLVPTSHHLYIFFCLFPNVLDRQTDGQHHGYIGSIFSS